MIVNIPYGQDQVDIEVDVPFEVLTPNEVRTTNPSALMQEALGQSSFAEFITDTDKLLVIVNDATRPTPTKEVLNEIKGPLLSHPDVKFLVATGAHRAPTEEECHFIFGDLYGMIKERVNFHDAHNSDMVYLGTSKNSTEMYLNSLVTKYRNILVIGSVEPHYFAGYTGGRKAFLPGVAAYSTIETNHKHALSDNALPLKLQGNPVAEDMADAMEVLKDLNIFSIQTVLTADHGLYAMYCADLTESFESSIAKANEVFCSKFKRKGNIVITAAPYPMDIDLYQSQKALENGKLVLEDGGIIILVSKCRQGVGDSTFLELLDCATSCEDVMQIIERGYRLGYHKAAKMAGIGIKSSMWVVCDLDTDTLKKAKLEPKASIQEALDEAISKTKDPYVVFLPQGSLTVPIQGVQNDE